MKEKKTYTPSADLQKKILEKIKGYWKYDPENGGFIKKKLYGFRLETPVGEQVGWKNPGSPHPRVTMFGRSIPIACLVWLYHKSEYQIISRLEFINGNSEDLRIENLRTKIKRKPLTKGDEVLIRLHRIEEKFDRVMKELGMSETIKD